MWVPHYRIFCVGKEKEKEPRGANASKQFGEAHTLTTRSQCWENVTEPYTMLSSIILIRAKARFTQELHFNFQSNLNLMVDDKKASVSHHLRE